MIAPLFDILEMVHEMKFVEEEDDEYPMNISLRRTKKTLCKMCKCTFAIYIPHLLSINLFVCHICSNTLYNQNRILHENYIYKKNVIQNIIPKLKLEIQEVSYLPSRVLQCIHFEPNNWYLN